MRVHGLHTRVHSFQAGTRAPAPPLHLCGLQSATARLSGPEGDHEPAGELLERQVATCVMPKSGHSAVPSRSCIMMRPAGSPPMVMSKKTLGLPRILSVLSLVPLTPYTCPSKSTVET